MTLRLSRNDFLKLPIPIAAALALSGCAGETEPIDTLMAEVDTSPRFKDGPLQAYPQIKEERLQEIKSQMEDCRTPDLTHTGGLLDVLGAQGNPESIGLPSWIGHESLPLQIAVRHQLEDRALLIRLLSEDQSFLYKLLEEDPNAKRKAFSIETLQMGIVLGDGTVGGEPVTSLGSGSDEQLNGALALYIHKNLIALLTQLSLSLGEYSRLTRSGIAEFYNSDGSPMTDIDMQTLAGATLFFSQPKDSLIWRLVDGLATLLTAPSYKDLLDMGLYPDPTEGNSHGLDKFYWAMQTLEKYNLVERIRDHFSSWNAVTRVLPDPELTMQLAYSTRMHDAVMSFHSQMAK